MQEQDDQPDGDLQITGFSQLLSQETLSLLEVTGENLLDTIGVDVIRSVVLDVLVGRNIRSSTENLTRRRIAALNLALVDMFIRSSVTMEAFVEQIPHIAARALEIPNTKGEEWLANWAIGLTGKGVQNVLRDDRNLIPEYRDTYIQTCREVIEQSRANYGDLTGRIRLDTGAQVEVNWLFMMYLLNMVGSQTLTIRGSEKSLYGKFFEKLILGSLLHVLDFTHVQSGNLENPSRVFWLSSNTERSRESDATILYELGRGIRIDIGFIGRGNTEISLDKVSRYRREIELGNRKWYMGTFIIVDRIGSRSRIQRLARDIDGTIIQMSGGYWPKRMAIRLNELLDYEHPLVKMDDDEIEDFLRKRLVEVPLLDFIRASEGT